MEELRVAPARPVQEDRLRALLSIAADQLSRHWTLVKFTLAGVLGYALYTGTLFLMYDSPFPFMPDKHTSVELGLFTHDDLRLLVGSVVAAQVSITGGFFARDLWVFTDRPVIRKPGWLRFLQYHAKSQVSTLGIISGTTNLLTLVTGLPHYISAPVGIMIGFVWNWVWESSFIWRRGSQAEDPLG